MDGIRKHKELAAMVLLAAVLAAAVYLSAMFRPGIWFGDSFLYRSGEGLYQQKDGFCSLELRPTSEGARAVFRIGEEQREYRLSTRTRMTEVFEDGRLKFRGTVQPGGKDGPVFLNERGVPIDPPAEGGPFPDFRQIYGWAMGRGEGRRGNPAALVFIVLFAAALAADCLFPGVLKQKLGPARQLWLRLGLAACLILSLLLGFRHFG